MHIQPRNWQRLFELAENVCSSTPGAPGDGSNLGGAGAGHGTPAPTAGPPAAPPAAPPAPPAPQGVTAEDLAALQRRAAKAEKELETTRAQMKDPAFLRGVINNAMGVKEDVDPQVLLRDTERRATAAEALARDALVRSAVVSAASELGAHNPLDVAELFPDGRLFELDGQRVKDYTAVRNAVGGFLQSRPYMLRQSPIAAPAPVPGAPPGPPAPPRGPEVPAGQPPAAPAFQLKSDAEVWAMTQQDRAKYLATLREATTTKNGMPWQ